MGTNTLTRLKARNLPIADGLPQDFKVILDKWASRGGSFAQNSEATQTLKTTPAA